MRNKIFIISCLIFFGQFFSQQYKVVNSETNEPIEGAIVTLNKKNIGQSDKAGIFTVLNDNVSADYQIKTNGFEILTFKATNNNSVTTLYLVPNAQLISEVILRSTLIPNTLQKTPAAINLITSSDFQRTDATNVLETFNNVPGVFINQGALNTNKINIRGIGARSQYSTNRIQSYFDGIPLSTAEGELTLDDFDQESLERIEIIKGPTSSIFGAGLGGSINLYSKSTNQKENTAKLNAQIGSDNTQKYTLQASSSTEKSGIFATVTNLTSDGFRNNGNYSRQSAVINGHLKTASNAKLSYLANFTKLKAFIPSSINKDTFLNNPTAADSSWEASEGYESYDQGLLGVSYLQDFNQNLQNSTSVFVSFRDGYEPRPFDILEELRISSGVRTQFNLSSEIFKLPSKVSFGAEYYNEYYKTGNFKNLYRDFPNQGSVQGERISQNQQDRNYLNIFSQINLNLTERWNLEAGLSFNSTNYKLADLFIQNGKDQSGDYQFKTIFSPRIATTYEIATGKNIYASVSRGFSTPSVAETLTPEGQINTDLQPETGTNYEVGFKGNWLANKLYTEISAYSIRISDLLVAQRVAEDQYVGVNAGKTTHNGLELLINYRSLISDNFAIKPYLSSAINFFKFEEFINGDEDFSGNKLPGVPEYTLNSGVDLQIGKALLINANYRNIGRIFLDDANSDRTETYQLFNFKASYDFNFSEKIGLKLYGGINNLFNEKYAASILTNAVGFGGRAARYYYAGNDRNYYGGLQLNFLF